MFYFKIFQPKYRSYVSRELLFEPSGEFENFLRMSSSDFSYILDKISPVISKKHTQLREPIPILSRVKYTIYYEFIRA